MKLNDQVGIITGAGSGMGTAIAERFAKAGIAGLTIADVNIEAAGVVAEDLNSRYDCKAVAVAVDVSDQDQVAAMAAQTAAQFGRIDILINNAGICPMVSWEDTTLDDWNKILRVNLTGPFLCTKAVAPYMQKRKYGRIIFISSLAAFTGSIVASVAYGVSKGGVIPLMKSVAKNYAADGILVNAVAPGSIDTPMTKEIGEEGARQLREGSLLKRQATPTELADTILFLVSDHSTFMTGATMHVNGGALLV
jgi:3-oxoacyl-[acyl-carrier protein] reductase